MLTVSVRQTKVKDLPEIPAREVTLRTIVDGPELLKNHDRDQWLAMHRITVYKGGKTKIMSFCKRKNRQLHPVIRARNGILKGVKITDFEGMLSATGEIAFHALNKSLDWKLQMPPISPKIFGDHQYDSCLSCIWHRQLRGGGDETEYDFSDDDGIPGRDMGTDMYEATIEPRFQCILFGIWTDVTFGIVDEMNHLIQGSTKKSGMLLNLGAGYGMGNWHNGEWLRRRMMETKACLFHRKGKHGNGKAGREVETFTIGNQRPITYEQAAQFAQSGAWVDIVPVGWMPVTDDGILVPGAVEMWNEKFKASPRELRQRGVQTNVWERIVTDTVQRTGTDTGFCTEQYGENKGFVGYLDDIGFTEEDLDRYLESGCASIRQYLALKHRHRPRKVYTDMKPGSTKPVQWLEIRKPEIDTRIPEQYKHFALIQLEPGIAESGMDITTVGNMSDAKPKLCGRGDNVIDLSMQLVRIRRACYGETPMCPTCIGRNGEEPLFTNTHWIRDKDTNMPIRKVSKHSICEVLEDSRRLGLDDCMHPCMGAPLPEDVCDEEDRTLAMAMAIAEAEASPELYPERVERIMLCIENDLADTCGTALERGLDACSDSALQL